jgi:hypothetical protein
MRAALLALLASLALACAHGKDDKTICPEYRAQHCLAGQECALDKERGCKVCHCEGVSQTGPDGNPTLPEPPK